MKYNGVLIAVSDMENSRRFYRDVLGLKVIKDFGASLRNFFGGRSGSYERELLDARTSALRELESRAREKGADAVVGIDIDYEVLGPNGGMLMVTASGTEVKLG